ncbi:rhodanese-like domain-containing protein [Maribacter sp. 2210JD10-5]|uniref:rhodanese-like domain-containing protein n=1 Tax=Maribacter sp. 2210JD10-5 TaxID=3386272 RepID=UPI0039BCA589
MKYYPILLLFVTMKLTCAQSNSKHITEFSHNDAKTGILIDVRTPEEFQAGHLDNALNINWFDADFEKQIKGIDKKKTVYVYCKKGGRSLKAQEKLISMGFLQVVNLEGGYDAWQNQKTD